MYMYVYGINISYIEGADFQFVHVGKVNYIIGISPTREERGGTPKTIGIDHLWNGRPRNAYTTMYTWWAVESATLDPSCPSIPVQCSIGYARHVMR